MNTQEQNDDAVTRLGKLADDLQKTYPAAGERVAKAIEPVDDAIRRIGVTYREEHYAENRRRIIEKATRANIAVPDGGRVPDTLICNDDEEGTSVEYILCASRMVVEGKRDCRLAVSVCRYREGERDWEDHDGEVLTSPVITIEEIRTLLPDQVPLSVRVRILDVIMDFAKAYEEHVRKERKALLNGSADPQPTK